MWWASKGPSESQDGPPHPAALDREIRFRERQSRNRTESGAYLPPRLTLADGPEADGSIPISLINQWAPSTLSITQSM